MDNPLIGKQINGIKIAEDKEAILFETDEGLREVQTFGDCCSTTWIEHVELPARGFPAKVISVEELRFPELDYDDEIYDFIQFYGCKIVTDKGELVIDYRNSSNGYYGGDLSWPGVLRKEMDLSPGEWNDLITQGSV